MSDEEPRVFWMTPEMIHEAEEWARVLTPTAREVDALIRAFDAAVLPTEESA